MTGQLLDVAPDRLGIRIAEAARMLGISSRSLQRLISAGKTPRSYRVGGVVVLRADDLREWARRGFPDRGTFESLVDAAADTRL